MSLQNQYRPLNPRLGTHYAIFVSAFTSLLLVLALLEQLGAPKLWLSHAMILIPLVLYISIAALTRTLDLHEFFCASRRMPPVFGGLALAVTAIGGVGLFAFTGSLYLIGFDALALAIGLISGFALSAALFVPYLRKTGAYTLPGFFRLRFDSTLLGAVAGLLVLPPVAILLAAELRIGAFVTSLFASVSFDVAVFCGAGLIIATLVIGGLRSLGWTQSVQYTVVMSGLLVPLVVVSIQETNLPLPQLTYGWLLERLSINEVAVGTSATTPPPLLGGLPGELPEPSIKPFLQAFGALSRADFAFLAFCVLAGVAAMPSLLLRSGSAVTTEQSRRLMGWSTLFVGFFLVTAPAYAVFAKYSVLEQIVGLSPSELPGWIGSLKNAGLADFTDRNGNGVISASELLISRDGVALSLPIVAGLPFILVVFAATAGIAATLAAGAAHAFAAGSAISDDIYHGFIHRAATHGKRLIVARLAMVILSIGAAWYVTVHDFDVLRAAIAAFSLAGATFLPPLVLSVWWKRATKWGVLAAMVAGATVSGTHMALQLTGAGTLFPSLSGELAGILGVPAGFVLGVGVSLLTPQPTPQMKALVDDMRDPSGEALLDKAIRLAPFRKRPSLPEATQIPQGNAEDTRDATV
ncbi:MAG: VC_2705 family sodium/solute symporter [Hyphomicrobiaceae bacterium]|nr:VC_2705 family sodium/solute symporter [Hyphomicrobiaceae bacterium]